MELTLQHAQTILEIAKTFKIYGEKKWLTKSVSIEVVISGTKSYIGADDSLVCLVKEIDHKPLKDIAFTVSPKAFFHTSITKPKSIKLKKDMLYIAGEGSEESFKVSRLDIKNKHLQGTLCNSRYVNIIPNDDSYIASLRLVFQGVKTFLSKYPNTIFYNLTKIDDKSVGISPLDCVNDDVEDVLMIPYEGYFYDDLEIDYRVLSLLLKIKPYEFELFDFNSQVDRGYKHIKIRSRFMDYDFYTIIASKWVGRGTQ